MKFLNRELVFVEEHTKCKCDCRKKESECTKFQRYDKSQCMCNCINLEDQNKCLAVSKVCLHDGFNGAVQIKRLFVLSYIFCSKTI